MENNINAATKDLGGFSYGNKKCWLAENLGHNPYKRCRYCDSRFRNCLFLQYQFVSFLLIFFAFAIFFIFEGGLSAPAMVAIFVMVIAYGYFFDKSTDRIIQANFIQRQSKKELEALSGKLEEKVAEQTKEIKAAYQRIEKAYEAEKIAHQEWRQLNEVKNQFLLSTQHHLRSPLSVVQGYLSMIADGNYGRVSVKIKNKIGACMEATRKLIRLVDELLDVAHFQMDKGVVVKQPTDAIALIDGIIADLNNFAKTKKIYLKLAKPNVPVGLINIDTHGIREAIYNIVDNAIKYTQEGGVSVSVGILNDKMRITVADTGIGIDPVEKNHIFKRIFERGSRAKEVNADGKGIGLYLAAQMIHGNGGKIKVESNGLGKGTVFTVDLPLEFANN